MAIVVAKANPHVVRIPRAVHAVQRIAVVVVIHPHIPMVDTKMDELLKQGQKKTKQKMQPWREKLKIYIHLLIQNIQDY